MKVNMYVVHTINRFKCLIKQNEIRCAIVIIFCVPRLTDGVFGIVYARHGQG